MNYKISELQSQRYHTYTHTYMRVKQMKPLFLFLGLIFGLTQVTKRILEKKVKTISTLYQHYPQILAICQFYDS